MKTTTKLKCAAFVALLPLMHYANTVISDYGERLKLRLENTEHRIVSSWARKYGFIEARPQKHWRELAIEQAEARGLNPCLVLAMVQVESANGTRLVSPVGAMGLMQLMRPTAAGECGLKSDADILDPENNIWCGTRYAAKLIKQHGVVKGLKAYNAGLKRIDRTEENRSYPGKILDAMAYCKL